MFSLYLETNKVPAIFFEYTSYGCPAGWPLAGRSFTTLQLLQYVTYFSLVYTVLRGPSYSYQSPSLALSLSIGEEITDVKLYAMKA
jgi:hypothetical protein